MYSLLCCCLITRNWKGAYSETDSVANTWRTYAVFSIFVSCCCCCTFEPCMNVDCLQRCSKQQFTINVNSRNNLHATIRSNTNSFYNAITTATIWTYGGVKRPHSTFHSRHVYNTGATSTTVSFYSDVIFITSVDVFRPKSTHTLSIAIFSR